MIALGVVSMTAAFLILGALYVAEEWHQSRRKRPWWREPKRGDVIEIGRRKWR